MCEANRRSEVHLSQERRLARISISIVWLFMFCHAWRAVPTFYEALHSADGLSVGVGEGERLGDSRNLWHTFAHVQIFMLKLGEAHKIFDILDPLPLPLVRILVYRVEKKTLPSSVTHVPSGLMGCASAALG